MASFTDNKGRVWHVNITVGDCRTVKQMTGVDLGNLLANEFAELNRLLGDIVLMVDVIYVCCKDEADANEITDVEFGQSLAGDSIEAACNAFIEAYADFCPSRQGQILRNLTAMTTAEHVENLEKVIQLTSSSSLTSLQESAG